MEAGSGQQLEELRGCGLLSGRARNRLLEQWCGTCEPLEVECGIGLEHQVARADGHLRGQREGSDGLGDAEAGRTQGCEGLADLCLDERFDQDVAGRADIDRAQLPRSRQQCGGRFARCAGQPVNAGPYAQGHPAVARVVAQRGCLLEQRLGRAGGSGYDAGLRRLQQASGSGWRVGGQCRRACEQARRAGPSAPIPSPRRRAFEFRGDRFVGLGGSRGQVPGPLVGVAEFSGGGSQCGMYFDPRGERGAVVEG